MVRVESSTETSTEFGSMPGSSTFTTYRSLVSKMSSAGTHAPALVPASAPAYVRPNSRFSSLWMDMRSRNGSHLLTATAMHLPLCSPRCGDSRPRASLIHDLALDHVAVARGLRRLTAARPGRAGGASTWGPAPAT